MINKFFKTIHNKYSRFFRFLFFLRYLFAIFLFALILFLFIPKLFNYENRAGIINKHLLNIYDYDILKYEKVEFKSFPIPNIEFSNALINLDSSKLEFNAKKFKIYPKLLSIYNYENFQSKKIVLKDSNVIVDSSNIKILIKNILTQKGRIYFDNLNLNITDKNNSLARIKNMEFSNYGYKKNIVVGTIYNRKFKTKISEKLDNINFRLLNSGLDIDIDLAHNQKNIIKGLFKSKILNSKLKFNFLYDGKVLNIHNSFFRSKNLSFKNKSTIILDPYLELNSNFKVENFNIKILNKLKIDKLLIFKEPIKKINSRNEIIFISKKFSQNLIDKFNLKINLAYGRLNFSKNISISESSFQCIGNTNLLEDSPLLLFECYIYSKNKKKFLKIFNINSKSDNKNLNIITKGNLNILNKKINFKEISIDENYKASREDLVYFKKVFESNLLSNSIIEIVNVRNLKKGMVEGS